MTDEDVRDPYDDEGSQERDQDYRRWHVCPKCSFEDRREIIVGYPTPEDFANAARAPGRYRLVGDDLPIELECVLCGHKWWPSPIGLAG